jgi:hypothetical protein
VTQRRDASLPDGLDALAHWQKAALLAALTLLGEENAAPVLGQLADGARCVAALAQISRLERADRARNLARLERSLAHPQPAGLAEIHPTWLERALHELDPRLQMAELLDRIDEPGANGACYRWLARSAFARFVPMPQHAVEPGPLRPRDLPRLSPARLARALRDFGLEQLAWALCRLERDEVIHMADLLPTSGDALLERIRELRMSVRRSQMLGPARWAVIRCRDLDLARDPHVFERLASRALAPHLRQAGGDVARQLAQRIAIDVGTAVYAEQIGQFGQFGVDTAPPLHAFERWLDS